MSSHQLVATNLRSPKFCVLCGKFISGLLYQALSCTHCGMIIHRTCEAIVVSSKMAKCPGVKDDKRPDKEFRGSTDGSSLKSGRPCVFELFAERCLLVLHKSTLLKGHKVYEWPIANLKFVAQEATRLDLYYDGKWYAFRMDSPLERDSLLACLANVKEAFSAPPASPLLPPPRDESFSNLSMSSGSADVHNTSLSSQRRISDIQSQSRPIASFSPPPPFSPSAPPPASPFSAPSTALPSAPPLEFTPTWQCKACTYINPGTRTDCEMCATRMGSPNRHAQRPQSAPERPTPLSLPPPVPSTAPEEWDCDVCTLRNEGQYLQCLACYTPRRCADPALSNEHEIQNALKSQKDLLKMWRAGNLNETAYKRLAAGLQGDPVGPAAVPTVTAPLAFELPGGVAETVRKQWYDWDTKMWMEQEAKVIIEWSPPLAQGNLRVALRMLDLSRPVGKQACVAKFVKEDFWDDERGEQQCYIDVEMQAHCQAVAEAFNQANPPKRVSFLEAWIISRLGPDLPSHKRILAAEPYMDATSYEKHNNNWGFVHPMNRSTPQAFSHFSWEYSQHRFIIVDIQGVGDVYTDPQMHSADDDGSGNGPWGMGNLGKEGIDKFLETHRCNAVCRALGLKGTQQQLTGSTGTQVPTRLQREPTLSWSASFRVSDYIRDIKPLRDGVTQEDLSLLKIDTEEFNTIVDMFNRIDADHNGVLTIDEVVAMLNGMGDFKFSPENTRYLMQLAQEKEVTFKRFLLWYKGYID